MSGQNWVPFETDDGYVAYKNEYTGEVSWENPATTCNINGEEDVAVEEKEMMANPMGKKSGKGHHVSESRFDVAV